MGAFLRDRGTPPQLLDRIHGCCSSALHLPRLLPHDHRHPLPLPTARYQLEVLQTHVQAATVPLCPRNTEVQCPGLQAKDGAVPEGDSEGQTGATDAETEGICVFAGRRESKSRVAGVRYDAREGQIWGDGKLEAKGEIKREKVKMMAFSFV